jgi:hypothetical protein
MSKITRLNINDQSLHKLYQRFYIDDDFSSVTSSFWKKYGNHVVRESGSGWAFDGVWFGDFRRRNFLNTARSYLTSRELELMSKKFDCSPRIWNVGKAVAKKRGHIFSFDCAKQVLAVDKVLKSFEIEGNTSSISTEKCQGPFVSRSLKYLCVIGDGWGYLGCLLKEIDPEVKIFSVNLGKSLFFDLLNTRLAWPQASLAVVERVEDIHLLEESDFLFLPAESYHLLQTCKLDLVFNIASMQEMSLGVVRNYMKMLRSNERGTLFLYCCNRESKTLPDGEQIVFSEYGWSNQDRIFFDELCPWYQAFPTGLLGRMKAFDGPVRHCLAELSTQAGV